MDYTLKRSRRKTIGIYVSDGQVEVRAPLTAPQSEIDRFMASKAAWIREKTLVTEQRKQRKQQRV